MTKVWKKENLWILTGIRGSWELFPVKELVRVGENQGVRVQEHALNNHHQITGTAAWDFFYQYIILTHHNVSHTLLRDGLVKDALSKGRNIQEISVRDT